MDACLSRYPSMRKGIEDTMKEFGKILLEPIIRETKLVWGRVKVRSNIGLVGEYEYVSSTCTTDPAFRVPTGRVVFEIGGGIREEIARDGKHYRSLPAHSDN